MNHSIRDIEWRASRTAVASGQDGMNGTIASSTLDRSPVARVHARLAVTLKRAGSSVGAHDLQNRGDVRHTRLRYRQHA
jgi:hypothetical protein